MLNPSGDTIGEILKRTREAKKLSIEEVNRHTKISAQVINSLEQDDLESFPGDTYLKGFLKTYATFLELDPDEIWGMVIRKRGKGPANGGTFWDIEEAVREEKLKSPKVFKRFVLPAIIIIVIVLSVLLVMKHREVKRLSGGVAAHFVIERGQI
jgi:cytoskeletal protein RodZ